ncbi:MAG: hypothetical protein L0216_10535 [Planctomycetales bacterium]|nr:hypothetical protein [Planctomycetales bacterium]
MHGEFKDRAEFLMVYVREAHPSDSNWADPMLKLADPKSHEARRGVARQCSSALKLEMPTVVDTMEDTVSLAYNGWPERIYVVRPDGVIHYRGGLGPFGFNPREARDALAGLLEGK